MQKAEEIESPDTAGTQGAQENDEESGAKGTEESDVDSLRKLAEDYKEMLQRLQAEFENAAKRASKEKEEFRKVTNAKLIEEFLPLVDSMQEAVKHAEASGNREMKDGSGKILSQLMKVLERNGVRQIRAMGQKFDAHLHECLMTADESGKADGVVLEELQKGYTLNGLVLRPAKVKVNKHSEKQGNDMGEGQGDGHVA